MQKAYDSPNVQGMPTLAQSMNVFIEKKVLNGVTVYYGKPSNVSKDFINSIFFHIHSGAYVFGKGEAGISEGIVLAASLNIAMVSVDYKMPPDHPYPAALEDVISAYNGLLELYPNHNILIGGSSTGGGLTMAALLKMKELKLKLPDVVYLGTPWSDLTKTGDSYYINDGIDRLLVSYDGLLEEAAKLYANGINLKDPFLSPIYGDLSGFPPTFLITGTRDLFLSNTVRTHRKLRDVGVEADLVVIEGMSHADHLFLPFAPESISVFKDLTNFVKNHFKKEE